MGNAIFLVAVVLIAGCVIAGTSYCRDEDGNLCSDRDVNYTENRTGEVQAQYLEGQPPIPRQNQEEVVEALPVTAGAAQNLENVRVAVEVRP